jgi:hypothetical protein
MGAGTVQPAYHGMLLEAAVAGSTAPRYAACWKKGSGGMGAAGNVVGSLFARGRASGVMRFSGPTNICATATGSETTMEAFAASNNHSDSTLGEAYGWHTGSSSGSPLATAPETNTCVMTTGSTLKARQVDSSSS